MSELRQRCEELLRKLHRYSDFYIADIGDINEVEAFAKQEQIKGMEAIKAILQAHHSRVWITEQIDAAIQQLKEGG